MTLTDPNHGRTHNFFAAEYNHILVALGANLGGQKDSPIAQLDGAVQEISKAGFEVEAVSRYWRTPAFPPGSGPDFVNAALRARCNFTPIQILSHLHAIEQEAGRVRRVRWGARVLDLDLLAVGDMVLPDAASFRHWMQIAPEAQQNVAPDELILPHPRLHERAFVLAPLVEIAPDWVHPVLGESIASLYAALPEGSLDGMAPISRENHGASTPHDLSYAPERSKDDP